MGQFPQVGCLGQGPRRVGGRQRGEPVEAFGVLPGPSAGVVGRRVLGHHERPVAGQGEQGLGDGLVAHRVAAGSDVRRVGQREQPALQAGVGLHHVGDLLAVPDAPVLARAPRRRGQLHRTAQVPGRERAAQRGHPHSRLRQGAQHRLQPRGALVPPVAEQFRVVGRDHEPAPPVLPPQRPQAGHDRVDEVVHVPAQRGRGRGRVVRRLVGGLDVLAGDPGGLEPDLVVPGVEVAVVRVARVSGLRRPHAVGDLQIASEADDLRGADGARGGGVAPQ